MIYFSFKETFFSVLCSLAYGCLFGVFLSLLSVSFDCIRLFAERVYKGVTLSFSESTRIGRGGRSKSSFGKVRVFLLIILFTIGYILLSYYSLDGQIRLYTMLLSLISLYLSWKLTSLSLQRLVFYIFDLSSRLLCILISFLLILPKRIFLAVNRMFNKNEGKLT